MARWSATAAMAGSALLVVGLMPAAAQENAATKAVEAAKQYAGTTINTEEEAGLMAMLGINITGPEWEELTGIKVRVSEVPYEELFPKAMLEHRAGTGAYDMLTIAPSWVADMVRAGALEPLDPYIEKYGVKSEFDDIAPAFRDWMTFDGKTYALVVDGDVHILYYRKDLFEDPANMEEFKAKYGYDLAPPDDWQKFGEICQFLTDKYAPELYGAGLINTGYTYYFFFERFRSYGGRFFDPETMKATVNSEAGVKALTDMVEQNKCQPPGRAELGLWRVALGAELGRDRDDHHLAAGRALGAGHQRRRAGAVLGAADPGQGQDRLCGQPERAFRDGGRHHAGAVPEQQEQGGHLPLHPMAAQPAGEPEERDAALGPARSVPHLALR